MLPLLAGPTPAPPPPCPWLSVCAHRSLHCTRYLLMSTVERPRGSRGLSQLPGSVLLFVPNGYLLVGLSVSGPVLLCASVLVALSLGDSCPSASPTFPPWLCWPVSMEPFLALRSGGRWPSPWSQPESQERAERIPGAPQRPWPGAAGQLVSTAPLWARSGGPHSQKGVGFVLSHPGLLLPLPDLNQNPLAPNSKDVDSPSLGRGEGWSLCLPRPRCHPGCFFSKTVNIDSALFC